MNKEIITSSITGDSYTRIKHKSGLEILVWEMPGYSSAEALFGLELLDFFWDIDDMGGKVVGLVLVRLFSEDEAGLGEVVSQIGISRFGIPDRHAINLVLQFEPVSVLVPYDSVCVERVCPRP